MIKAVLFDRDGVLINSEGVNIAAAETLFLEFGIQITDEDKREIVGKPPIDYLPYFMKKYVFDVDTYNSRIIGVYNKLFDKADIFSEAVQLVKRTKKEFICTLTTGGYKEANDMLFRRAGLDNTFDVVVSREEYTKGKPDPESYLVTMQKLGLQAHECVAIEDSDRGLLAAKAAGIKCIVIPNEYTKDQDFSLADKIVMSAREITKELIESLK